MKYIKVHWVHEFVEEPEMLYSEIDDHNREIRKVEVFKDGTMGYANADMQSRSRLAECEMPSCEEIAQDPQFTPYPIDKAEFIEAWEKSQRV